jgi:hypothetical protein
MYFSSAPPEIGIGTGTGTAGEEFMESWAFIKVSQNN